MNKVSLQLIIKSLVNSGYYTESLVIRLGIFVIRFYLFEPEGLTTENAKPYYITFHVITCLLYDLAIP